MTDGKVKKPRTSRPDSPGREVQWRRALPGFLLGVFTALLADEVLDSFMPVPDEWMIPLWGLFAAALALTPARRWNWWIAGAVWAVYLTLGWTPLLDSQMRAWVRTDPPRKADAAVVLSSDIRKNGKPYRVTQVRLLAGYEAVTSGLAPVLVLTRLPAPRPSMVPFAKQQLEALGTHAEVIEPEATVRNTRDEAKAVAELARRRGWKRLIVVTDGMHLRRSAALFEREGLEVIARSCLEDDYDLSGLHPGKERLRAFRAWSHEVIGWQVYRMRGWL